MLHNKKNGDKTIMHILLELILMKIKMYKVNRESTNEWLSMKNVSVQRENTILDFGINQLTDTWNCSFVSSQTPVPSGLYSNFRRIQYANLGC